jgi:hypothetical protein
VLSGPAAASHRLQKKIGQPCLDCTDFKPLRRYRRRLQPSPKNQGRAFRGQKLRDSRVTRFRSTKNRPRFDRAKLPCLPGRQMTAEAWCQLMWRMVPWRGWSTQSPVTSPLSEYRSLRTATSRSHQRFGLRAGCCEAILAVDTIRPCRPGEAASRLRSPFVAWKVGS